jgi:hypothetical protein
MEPFVIIVLVVLAVLVLFGIGASPPPPAPAAKPAPPVIDMLLAERVVLLAKLDLDLQATELRLRQGGSVQAAEGAAIVRARAMEFIKGYK